MEEKVFLLLKSYSLCADWKQPSMSSFFKWTFFLSYIIHFLNHSANREWKVKRRKFRSHNWAAHEWMNRTQKASIIKLFPLAVLLASLGSCVTKRKRGIFVIMKIAIRNSHLSMITNTEHESNGKKEKCKQCVGRENFNKADTLFAVANF